MFPIRKRYCSSTGEKELYRSKNLTVYIDAFVINFTEYNITSKA